MGLCSRSRLAERLHTPKLMATMRYHKTPTTLPKMDGKGVFFFVKYLSRLIRLLDLVMLLRLTQEDGQ